MYIITTKKWVAENSGLSIFQFLICREVKFPFLIVMKRCENEYNQEKTKDLTTTVAVIFI